MHTNYEKLSYNVHQQIEFIKKYKLNSDSNIKEKVCLEFGTQLELKNLKILSNSKILSWSI